MTEPGTGSSQAGVAPDRAVWWLGIEDLRKWRPETSMVAQARMAAQRRG
jgi:hypothetical protein